MSRKKVGNDVSMQTLRKVLKLIGRYRLLETTSACRPSGKS